MSEDKRIGAIINLLDLGFSDIFDGENVRQQTLVEKLDIIEEIVELIKLEEAINFSVFSSIGNKCPSAEIYSKDFPSDLRASIYLLLGGFYKQAILCLRNWYEMRLTGIYFSFIETDKAEFEKWKQGQKEDQPIGRGLIKKLFGKAEFHQKDNQLNLRNDLNQLYSDLSAFTHGAILDKYDLQAETDNVPRFNPQSVDIYSEFTKKVFNMTTICFLLAFQQKAFSSLQPEEKNILKKHLPPTHLQEFQQTSTI